MSPLSLSLSHNILSYSIFLSVLPLTLLVLPCVFVYVFGRSYVSVLCGFRECRCVLFFVLSFLSVLESISFNENVTRNDEEILCVLCFSISVCVCLCACAIGVFRHLFLFPSFPLFSLPFLLLLLRIFIYFYFFFTAL